MFARIILANPEGRLYAAQVSVHGRIIVFALAEGSHLRIGDIIRGSFGYPGESEALVAGTNEPIVIRVLRTRVSPAAANDCIHGETCKA